MATRLRMRENDLMPRIVETAIIMEMAAKSAKSRKKRKSRLQAATAALT